MPGKVFEVEVISAREAAVLLATADQIESELEGAGMPFNALSALALVELAGRILLRDPKCTSEDHRKAFARFISEQISLQLGVSG